MRPFPLSLIVMFGVMLKQMRHAMVIYSVMTILFVGMAGWPIYWDTLHPNPGLIAHSQQAYEAADATVPGGKRMIESPVVAGLPVDQDPGTSKARNCASERPPGPPSQPSLRRSPVGP